MNKESSAEFELRESLSAQEVVETLIGTLEQDDIEFLTQQVSEEESETLMSAEDILGYAYGRLLELDQNPDKVLRKLGLLEEG